MPGPDLRVSVAVAKEKGWPAVFSEDVPTPLALVVELGFGRGEFLAHLAENAPHTAHVGVEVSAKRVLKMARRTARSELRNLRFIQGSAEEVVAEVLDDASVSTFWINFPDPWPKKRHQRRRMLSREFLELLSQKLEPGGNLEIATDHVDYADWIDRRLAEIEALENLLAPQPHVAEVPGRFPTAYELEWRSEGRPLHFWRYRRRTP
ncbi:MAG: tRNA (guanosine(46)-N7)-methyltransferase TrmB [Myxococcales bacterium]|nr:tRNA (guanosine(46)-N7)-methyltransferase TrmB [Myxococcales bacterium]